MRAVFAALFALVLSLPSGALATVGATQTFDTAWLNILDGTVDLDDDTFRWVLVRDTYSPSEAHDTWSDISANEVPNGSGYATHGTAATITITLSAGTVTVDASEPEWDNSSISAKFAMLVRDANGDGVLAASDMPIMRLDLRTEGGSLTSVNDVFRVTTPSGVLVSPAPN